MRDSDSANQTHIDREVSRARLALTDYQVAVLSTLFDQQDSGKVIDLAQQWGYQQELLHSVWNEMHAEVFNEDEKAIAPSSS